MIFFAAGWLYTYNIFTRETPVAEVIISPIQEDELGKYFNVSIYEIAGKSPIEALFNPDTSGKNDLLDGQTVKLYGDQVDIGGPTIKFKNFLYLFNFETVYKIAFVRAEYADIEMEDERVEGMTRRVDLNGGYSTWRSIQEDIQSNNFRGEFLKLFIDNLPQINSRGVFVNEEEQRLTLCVTEEGFFFCDQEI